MIRRSLNLVDGVIAGLALFLALWFLAQEMIARWLFGTTFTWTEDLSRVLLIVLAYFGASAVVAEDGHIRVEFILDALPQRVRTFVLWLINAISLGFCVIAVWLGARLAYDTASLGMSFAHSDLPMPVWVAQAAVPVAFAMMAIRILLRMISAHTASELQPHARVEG